MKTYATTLSAFIFLTIVCCTKSPLKEEEAQNQRTNTTMSTSSTTTGAGATTTPSSSSGSTSQAQNTPLPMLFGYSAEKTADNQEPTPADDVHSYLSAGVRLPAFSPDWEFIASTLIRWVPNAPTSLVFNAGIAYQKTELSLGYHHDGTLGAQLLIQPRKGLAIGYSYQFPTPTLLSKINTSNHELMVRIPLSKKE